MCLLPRRADTLGVLVGSGARRFEFPWAEGAAEPVSPDTQTAGEREVSFSCFGYFFISKMSASAWSKSIFTAGKASRKFPHMERTSERCSLSEN